jgi:hypothetical protein
MPERRKVYLWSAAEDQVSDQVSGHRRCGHADMAMSEGIYNVGKPARLIDHRQ